MITFWKALPKTGGHSVLLPFKYNFQFAGNYIKFQGSLWESLTNHLDSIFGQESLLVGTSAKEYCK